MKRLILLTNSFPYDNGETYLETEVKYYNQFDEIDIFSLAVKKKTVKREIDCSNAKIYPIYFASKPIYALNGIRVLADINFYKEIVKLIKSKRLNIKTMKSHLIFKMRARYQAPQIINHIKKNN